MSAVCPNCNAPVAADAPACPACGASFADGSAWKPQTDEESSGTGAASLAGISHVAAAFAWLIPIAGAFISSRREVGSMELFGSYFMREVAGGRLGFWLACAALVAGILAAALSRGKKIAWFGLVVAALFLGIRFLR